MAFFIRPAQKADATALAEITGEFEMYAYGSMKPKADIMDRVRERIDTILGSDRHLLLTAWDDSGALCGYAAVHWLPYLFLPGVEGYLSELFVGEKWRGTGLGSLLISAVEAEAVKHGCYRLMLINSRERESYERDFYKKKGWAERPEMANFVRILV
ncbi:MAG: GNAT family N-acetyltransferase [Deltaproteobacteria bacterium]|nr:GNAT family N-acetyltransferase [Candidatus Zymogenaceae bacterium]